MRSKILLLFVLFTVTPFLAEAKVFPGSVGNGGAKFFTISVGSSATALVHLVYENPNSDLDLGLGIRDSGGNLIAIAVSGSALKRFEQMEVGIVGGVVYTVVVNSIRGASAFRVNIDASGVVAGSSGIQIKEVAADTASLRLLDQIRKIQKATKK